MPKLTVRTKRLSATADVPESMAKILKRVRSRAMPAIGRASQERVLTFSDPPRPLQIEQRDPIAAASFLRSTLPDDVAGRYVAGGSAEDLARGVEAHRWYHTIELPGGVVTPGILDHRPLVPHYGIPATLAGKRALDVATFDGFWAFEMERRGASVVAIDLPRTSALDLPPQVTDALVREGFDRESGDGFRLAHAALGSQVRREVCSVYDLSPDTVGVFDFVHAGDLLLHLERPLAALRGIRRVTSGTALIADCFDPELKEPDLIRYRGAWSGAVWWMPSLDALAQMVIDAGFADVSVHRIYNLGSPSSPHGPWRAALLATI